MGNKKKTQSDKVSVHRATSESEISVTLDHAPRGDIKGGIQTPLHFFNHMLETLAWRACMNLKVNVKLSDYKLTHVLCEDTGIAVGEAFCEILEKIFQEGVNGAGVGIACIDEALARCVASFEGRAQIHLSAEAAVAVEHVEDMQTADLVGFLEGFTQGARATLHIDLLKGSNPHHVWEGIFRAFGEALRIALAPCPWRAGTTPGVKGQVKLVKES
ncbi:MAG: hypothetical protein AB1546_12325 [bacterium]